jgi:hypothetical protein
LDQIDRFNADILIADARLSGEVAKCRDSLLAREEWPLLDPQERIIGERFAFADALAIRGQRGSTRTLLSLLALVLVAFGALETYDNLVGPASERSWSLGVLLLFPTLLVSAFMIHRISRRRQVQVKHLDYRALAEGLRVQLFWNVARVGEDVADCYLRKQSAPLRWVQESLRISNVPFESRPASERSASARRELVLRRWVESQFDYFQRARNRDDARMRWIGRTATLFYGASLASTLGLVAIALAAVLDMSGTPELPFWTGGALFTLAAVSLGAAGALRGYSETMGLSEHVLHYERMRALFEAALAHLQELKDDDASLASVVRSLGEESLRENGDWVVFHHGQPLEVQV